MKLIVLIMAIFFSETILATQSSAPVWEFREATATVISPASGFKQKKIDLPHKWNGELDGLYGEIHYTITFKLEQVADEQWCLLIPRINMNARARINHYLVGDGGSFEEPLGRNWQRPLNFCFPAQLLSVGNNTISIELKSVSNRFGQLSVLYLGTKSQITPIYSGLLFTDQTVYEMTTSLSFILSFIIGFLWLQKRDASAWLWFSLAGFVWGISGLNVIVTDIPISTRHWEWMVHSSISLLPLFMVMFIHRLQQRKPIKLERLMVAIMGIWIVVLFFTPLSYFFRVADYLHGFSILLGFYCVWSIAQFYLQTRSREFLIILLALALILLFAVHDMLVQINFFPPGSTFLLNFSIPAFLLIVTMLLINQFISAVKSSKELNLTLEARVKSAEAQIEQTYQQLLKLETGRVVDEERDRIMHDLHDELGGKLLTLVYEAKDEPLQKLARSTLDDMRELVRAGQAAPIELKLFLADRRLEVVRQIEKAGLKYVWNVDCDKVVYLGGKVSLHLKRIVNEAVVNAIKHADANIIEICTVCIGQILNITIKDDGHGFDISKTDSNGISGMKKRASKIGANIKWQTRDTGGTVVTLILEVADD